LTQSDETFATFLFYMIPYFSSPVRKKYTKKRSSVLQKSPLTVLHLTAPEETLSYFRLARDAFAPQMSDEDAQRWQHFVSHSPEFRPEQVRGAFRGDQLLGGYIMYERILHIGAARISTGCIGAVATNPAYRNQGVATALMQDAFAFARQWNHPLLLLDGIPNFYYRYGYTDLFDATAVEIDRSALLALPPTEYRICPAEVADAPAMLGLYQRHFGGYMGSFERTEESQTYRLQHARRPPVVALSPRGDVEGYLYHGTGEERAMGHEVAADNWNALLALLHYHAHLLDDAAEASILRYALPPDAPMTHWLIDTLEVPDTSHWHETAEGWSVRTMTYHHRFAGWMGGLTSFLALMRALLPELQARWRRSLAQWNGEILLAVDRQECLLRITGAEVQLVDEPHADPAVARLELTPQALVQGTFGYRPLARVTDIAHLSSDVGAVLAILFPLSRAWIPRTDWF
jgi:predicted N-acetyltransferase YhbS